MVILYTTAMPKSQLPYLVRLLDDEASEVRKAVLRALEEIGPGLEGDLEDLGIRLRREEEYPIRHLLEKGRRRDFRASWRTWFTLKGDKQRLEAALQTIVLLQDGRRVAAELPGLLDELAASYQRISPAPDALGLSGFLFGEKGIKGVDQSDYHNPLNSNLVYVVTEKRGLPISLASVFLLVGHRLGLSIEGCNFPGHFLTIAPVESRRVVVDCYNSGRMINESDLASMGAPVSMKDLLGLECRSVEIIARVLRNLVNAYNQAGNAPNARLMTEALSVMNSEAVPRRRRT
jgi:regulator of sirC expression with transglutaminase-like and TPR domain